MRGTVLHRNLPWCVCGITPARAGNRTPCPWPSAWAWNHPRACGEQQYAACDLCPNLGSPPRVRGTANTVRVLRLSRRITPARAGNRFSMVCIIVRGWDHPRACGEQRPVILQGLVKLGSPPRVRGTGPDTRIHTQAYRITPARAGNSTAGYTSSRMTCGSPPRVRGTEAQAALAVITARITPARAGNRSCSKRRETRSWDHPRACGEQLTPMILAAVPRGSPPRVRGTAVITAAPDIPWGITPARAGNSIPVPGLTLPAEDHPRACGEQPSVVPAS